MPLWLIFTFAYFVFVIVVVGSAGFFLHVVLPPIQMGNEAFLAAGGEVVTASAILLVVIGLLFFILSRVTARPTRKLTEAVDAFATKGERIPVVIPSLAPREVKRLSLSFINLVKNVQEARERDAQIARVKSDFISTAAHQLRTPLTGIRWALEALSRGELTEEQRALAKNATDKSHELVNIVGTLLDISAIESGKYKYTFAEVNVVDVVNEVLADFKQSAGESGVSLSLEVTEDTPRIKADGERIKWVLNNLVENAIRYTPSGGAVRVGISYSKNHVFIAVRDNGIGIPMSDRGNIFERFYRGSNAASKENEGNGLGLYIARTIATDHGGDLTFKANIEGPGTTFTLTLPVGGPING